MTAPTLSLVHVVRPARQTSPGAKSPLLILMHGVGGNERAIASIADAFDPRFVVVSLRSPIELGPDSYGFFHVTFGSSGPVIVPEEAEAGWHLVARVIDEAVAAYGADPARVYVCGFSQGGIMALAAIVTSPLKIAGAVCMSGRLLPEVLPHAADRAVLAGKPILIVHGTVDETLGVHFARSARDTLTPLGFDVTYKEFPMRHQISRESRDTVTAWLTARLDAPTMM